MLDNRPVRWLVGLWIDMQAVPMLLLVYFPAGRSSGSLGVSVSRLALPIVMCTSATTAEVFRPASRRADQRPDGGLWLWG